MRGWSGKRSAKWHVRTKDFEVQTAKRSRQEESSPRRWFKITLEKRMAMEAMLERGVSKAAIARELGCSRQTIYEYIRRRTEAKMDAQWRADKDYGKMLPVPTEEGKISKEEAKRLLAKQAFDTTGMIMPQDKQRALKQYAELEGWAVSDAELGVDDVSEEEAARLFIALTEGGVYPVTHESLGTHPHMSSNPPQASAPDTSTTEDAHALDPIPDQEANPEERTGKEE